jgi:hypothetical protein
MKNIVENNKLIAEFMECIINGNDFIFPKEMYYLYQPCFMYEFESSVYNFELDISEVKFNKSWDWLMPVVEKIESLPDEENNGAFFFEIYQDSVSIIFSNDDYIIDLINVMGQGSRINNVYQAVVEFIQLYNKANKSLS